MEITDTSRVKVGRLKPGEGDLIHLFVDGIGELIMITRQEAERLVAEDEGMVVVAQVDEVEYWVFVWQLRNMLEKWPRKKVAVYRVGDRISLNLLPGKDSAEKKGKKIHRLKNSKYSSLVNPAVRINFFSKPGPISFPEWTGIER